MSVRDEQDSQCFLCFQFQQNLVILSEEIVVGAFIVIALNTIRMAHFGVMPSVLANAEVSVLTFVVLIQVCYLCYRGGIWLIDAHRWERYVWNSVSVDVQWVIVLEGFSQHRDYTCCSCLKLMVTVMMVSWFRAFMCSCCNCNKQGWLWVVLGFWGSWLWDINRVFILKIIVSARIISCWNSNASEP